jgi:hypothetical protein
MPQLLADKRPLPATLPAALLTAEGPSMYWYWKNLNNFQVGCVTAALHCQPGAEADSNWQHHSAMQPPTIACTLLRSHCSAVTWLQTIL